MTQTPERIPQPARLFGKGCSLELTRPRIMGILNVTPDSFSDGGHFYSLDNALTQARQMITQGADLLDIGGESTRPGAKTVSLQEELDRVLPVIQRLRDETDIPLSIDTNKASVAAASIAEGANFINDISGLKFDSLMAHVAAETGAGLFLMHTPGRPDVMQQQTDYEDLIGEVTSFLLQAAASAIATGVDRHSIALDPGIGFGKNIYGNLALLKHLDFLVACGYPVLLGTSRKSFIGQILQMVDPSHRLAGTLASVALGVERGAQIFRVHDVRPAREAALVAWAIREGAPPVT
ncbi:dihydropteroate synthase [Geopsychrobacter electrodiphilus]|uniref:dihydropteroate synthase n=1 Tax=Geopsychrobacter electrodiphilus TaxID=225196 RepID=UPI001FDFF578|nr:dihydropteroate synthase [Geopsychrobacter electrodiphilus]